MYTVTAIEVVHFNSTDSANKQCAQDYSDELWKCGVAQVILIHLTTRHTLVYFA